jgi:protein-disulfide isomerase
VKLRISVMMLAVVAVLGAVGVPPSAQAAQHDWTRTVVATGEGGFRMGNPDAAVKLVEYASYTCPHCADFAAEASPTLKGDFVRSGRMSWEFRPYLLFPTDPGITMLVRCQGAAGAFTLGDQIFAQQAQWRGRLQALPDAEKKRLGALAPDQQLAAVVRAAGIDQFFRQRGMPQARINSCLADKKGLEQTLAITRAGREKYQVSGTPTFFINGVKVADTWTWQKLQPALRQALAR